MLSGKQQVGDSLKSGIVERSAPLLPLWLPESGLLPFLRHLCCDFVIPPLEVIGRPTYLQLRANRLIGGTLG